MLYYAGCRNVADAMDYLKKNCQSYLCSPKTKNPAHLSQTYYITGSLKGRARDGRKKAGKITRLLKRCVQFYGENPLDLLSLLISIAVLVVAVMVAYA